MEFFDEQFWLAVSFIVFILLAYRPLKNVILKSLDDKINAIKNQVFEAQKLKSDMAKLHDDISQKINQLGQLKETMLQEGKATTNKLIEKQALEIDHFLENKKQEAINIINNKKLLACQEVQAQFSDKIVALISAYLKEQGDNLLDSEIAKKLMEQKQSSTAKSTNESSL